MSSYFSRSGNSPTAIKMKKLQEGIRVGLVLFILLCVPMAYVVFFCVIYPRLALVLSVPVIIAIYLLRRKLGAAFRAFSRTVITTAESNAAERERVRVGRDTTPYATRAEHAGNLQALRYESTDMTYGQAVLPGLTNFVKHMAAAAAFAAVLFVVAWIFSPAFRYSIDYSAPMANVTIQDKPENCDYDWSPIGKKGCHYEKSVNVFQDDNAQNHVIVSWDREDDQ